MLQTNKEQHFEFLIIQSTFLQQVVGLFFAPQVSFSFSGVEDFI